MLIFVNRFFYPDHSATSQLLSDLAFELAGTGSQVRVITSRQIYDRPDAGLPREETLKGVSVYRVWSSTFGRGNLILRALDYITFYASVCITLLIQLRRGDVVVAKTDPPFLSLVVGLTTIPTGARLVNWLQDLYPEVFDAFAGRKVRPLTIPLRWLRNRSLQNAAVNVVIGDRMRQHLISEGVAQERVEVIHNWIDGNQVFPIERKSNQLAKDWKLDNQFVVEYSGNMGRVHDLSTIVDAIGLIGRADPDVLFLFIGGGAKYAELAETLNKCGNVQFRPYQPQEKLAESLSLGDIHLVSLQPSMEGLIVPSKFYGVAAVGRVTLFVGAPDGEVAAMLAHFDCGISVSSGDAKALAEAVLYLKRDRLRTLEMGRNARKAFDSALNRDVAMRRWREVLAGV